MPTQARTPAVVLFAALGLVGAARADDEFQPLVEGTDPEQFALIHLDSDSVRISDDGVVTISGTPNGYLATKKSYKNYILEFEWMYERPDDLASDDDFNGNSGLLLNIEGPHKVWPRSIEFQMMNKEIGKIYPIGGAKLDGTWDGPAARKATKPVGEWNAERVTSEDGTMTCTLNGVEVTRGTKPDPAEGQIGWQSEGSPLKLRKLRIKVLD